MTQNELEAAMSVQKQRQALPKAKMASVASLLRPVAKAQPVRPKPAPMSRICVECNKLVEGRSVSLQMRDGGPSRLYHGRCYNVYFDRLEAVRNRRLKVESVLRQLPVWKGARVGNSDFMNRLDDRLGCFIREWSYAEGSVAVLGLTGAGKTMGLTALAHRLGAAAIAAGEQGRHFVGLVWVHAYEVGECVKWHKLGAGKPPGLEQACNATILMLDDLGQETAGTEQTLLRLIDARYVRGAVTLLTSGLTQQQLRERYGEHFVRRIAETGHASLIDLHPRAKLGAVR